VNRDVQSVLLVLVGGAVLRISLGGTYLRYVKEGLQPFLLAAGAVLVALGVLALVGGRGRDPWHGAGEGPGHGPDHGPAVAWLLVLPVLAIFLVAPPALGSYAAARDANAIAAPTGESDFPPLPDGEPVRVSLMDYATRAVWDEGRTLAGRTVRLTGFVTPREGGNWYLTRIALTCCAADGLALKVDVRGAPDYPADTWVEVTGRWVPGGGVMNDEAIPRVEATDVVEVAQPRNPYDT
jgi:uncharacterized repeat protein (TIGR03943 family)